jgi:hypothetical protein
MTDAPEIVDEKAAAEIRSIRARKALVYAPGLAEHLRRALTPADGRTERGFAPGDRTPLNTAITDAADELYVLVYGWAQSWAAWLRTTVPIAPVWRDRVGNDLGIRGGTSPRASRMLVESQTFWLLSHHHEIGLLPNADGYHDEISTLVWQLRAYSGLITHKRGDGVREKSLLVCERCGEPDMMVEYFGAPISTAELRGEDVSQGSQGVDVYCEACNWVPEFNPSKMVKWLRLGTTTPVSIEEVTQTKATIARSHESVTVWRPNDAA